MYLQNLKNRQVKLLVSLQATKSTQLSQFTFILLGKFEVNLPNKQGKQICCLQFIVLNKNEINFPSFYDRGARINRTVYKSRGNKLLMIQRSLTRQISIIIQAVLSTIRRYKQLDCFCAYLFSKYSETRISFGILKPEIKNIWEPSDI